MSLDARTSNDGSSSLLTDRDLIEAIRAGQADALGLIYDRYVRLVYGLALNVLASPEEAEDITHDVFLTLWQRNVYNPDRGSLSSFLATLTRSRAIDKLRSRGSRGRALQRLQGVVGGESATMAPLEHASLEERSHRVKDALQTLSSTEREVLEIAYFEGLTQTKIAQRLNIPLGTVKTRSRQGLLKLRQYLHNHI